MGRMRAPIREPARIAPPLPSEQPTALIVEPKDIFLGIINPGQRITTPVTIRNSGDVRLVVDRIDSSCPCARMNPSRVVIAAGGSVRAEVEYDPTSEPEFRGLLAISVTGSSADHVAQFRLTVHVQVEAPQTDRR